MDSYELKYFLILLHPGDDPQTANAPPSTSVNPTALPNPLNASKLDRSVSFHPHTTVFEMMSNSGNSNTANSSNNRGVSNVEEGTCHLAGEGVNGNNLTALDMMNNTHAAALKASDATVFDMIQDDANVDASVLDVVKNKQVEQTFSELPQQQEQNPIAKKCSCGSDKKDQSTVLYEPGLTDMSRAAKGIEGKTNSS